MPPLFVHRKAWQAGVHNAVSFARSDHPAICPKLLMAAAVLKYWPPKFPRFVTVPFSQSTACRAPMPSSSAHGPEIPTICPLSLIATAAPSGSPGYVGSCCISPFFGPHTTGSYCSTAGGIQLGSCVVFSAHPTTCPKSFTPAARQLLPPRLFGRAAILPFSHTTPSQVNPLPNPQKFSPNGSGVVVSDTPSISPKMFLLGKSTALFGPPSVPRSTVAPYSQRVACCAAFPVNSLAPVTHPRSLIPLPEPKVPPSVPRLNTR